MSRIARHLEQNGIPTVVIGSARDIVEHAAVPRFVFTDFPLGNPAGLPWQPEMRKAVVALALDLLESATAPRNTVNAPFRWNGDPGWRAVHNRVTPENAEYLRQKGEQRRRRMLEHRPEKGRTAGAAGPLPSAPRRRHRPRCALRPVGPHPCNACCKKNAVTAICSTSNRRSRPPQAAAD